MHEPSSTFASLLKLVAAGNMQPSTVYRHASGVGTFASAAKLAAALSMHPGKGNTQPVEMVADES